MSNLKDFDFTILKVKFLQINNTKSKGKALTYELAYVKIIAHFKNGCYFLRRGIWLMRDKITLECTVCKHRNYDTSKNKKNTPDRLERKKFCKFCQKTTVHKEAK